VAVTACKRCRGYSGVEELEHQDQTDVIVNWSVETCDEVTPSNSIAEVAAEKAAAELCPESSGVITLLEDENREIAQGAPIARAT
jgi:pyruvate/2-oxoglutarate dehydrogenase complex dihydrolipoamide acyltransferase (E2) component